MSPLGDRSFGSEDVTSMDLGSETVTVALGATDLALVVCREH